MYIIIWQNLFVELLFSLHKDSQLTLNACQIYAMQFQEINVLLL